MQPQRHRGHRGVPDLPRRLAKRSDEIRGRKDRSIKKVFAMRARSDEAASVPSVSLWLHFLLSVWKETYDCSDACQLRSAARLIRLTSRNSVKPRSDARRI